MNDEETRQVIGWVRDIRWLLRLQLRKDLQEIVGEAFGGDENQQAAFRLLARGKSYREIGSKVGVSHQSVARWVSTWKDLGLVDPSDNTSLVDPGLLGL